MLKWIYSESQFDCCVPPSTNHFQITITAIWWVLYLNGDNNQISPWLLKLALWRGNPPWLSDLSWTVRILYRRGFDKAIYWSMLENYKCRVTMILVRNEFALTKFRQTSIMWILRRLMQAWWRISPSQKIERMQRWYLNGWRGSMVKFDDDEAGLRLMDFPSRKTQWTSLGSVEAAKNKREKYWWVEQRRWGFHELTIASKEVDRPLEQEGEEWEDELEEWIQQGQPRVGATSRWSCGDS